MSNVNSVNLSGNLTRDPELRQTASGTSVLTFGIAVNDNVKNKQTNEWENYANFIECTIFGARADGLSQCLVRGTKVCITGKLHWSSWKTQAGETRSKLEVIVDNLDFATNKQQPAAAPAPVNNVAPVATVEAVQPQVAPQPQVATSQAVANNPGAYDDIPF